MERDRVHQIVALLGSGSPRHPSDLRQTWAVFLANLKIFLSYRTWVATETITTLASVVMYYFVGVMVNPQKLAASGYGESYIGFALVGIASTNYLWMCINRLSHSMSHEIREGTFETVISSPIKLRSYVIGISIRGFLVSCYFMLGAFLIGYFALDAPLIVNPSTLAAAVLLVLLLVTSHLGIGIMAAGIVMVYKKGDPLTFLLSGVTELFGGVLFPLYLLKRYTAVWVFAWLLPYTHALDALRKVLLLGMGILDPEIVRQVVILTAYSVVLIPLGLWIFRWGYDRVRREGTTTTY